MRRLSPALALSTLLIATILSGCASGPGDAEKPPPAAPLPDVQVKIEQRPCDLPEDLLVCPAEVPPEPGAWTDKAKVNQNAAENIVAGDVCRQKLDATRQLYLARCRKPAE